MNKEERKMKKTYISPRTKHLVMLAVGAFAAVESNVINGVTDNKSITNIGFGGGNSGAPAPSANKSLWDDGEEEE